MPLFEYACPKCGHFERYLPVAQYDEPQVCDCGEKARKMLSLPTIFVKQHINYESPIDGRHITNAQQRKEDLSRSGCVEYDPGIKQDHVRRIEQSEKELERKLDETVERQIEQMPPRKFEKLAQEIEKVDIQPIRQ